MYLVEPIFPFPLVFVSANCSSSFLHTERSPLLAYRVIWASSTITAATTTTSASFFVFGKSHLSLRHIFISVFLSLSPSLTENLSFAWKEGVSIRVRSWKVDNSAIHSLCVCWTLEWFLVNFSISTVHLNFKSWRHVYSWNSVSKTNRGGLCYALCPSRWHKIYDLLTIQRADIWPYSPVRLIARAR